jgi:signal recognition particle subunit SRP54
MFESLSEKLTGTIKKIRGQNKITEANVEETLKEIRLSLLEADVNFKVVKSFIDQVKTKALGQKVTTSLNPGQQLVKIVHDELVTTLGGGAVDINVRENPSVIMLVGLQGAGKTTSTAKLALYIRQKLGKKVGLVPADVYRPAAIEQLMTLAKQNDFSVYPTKASDKPQDIVRKAKDWAKENIIDVLILDTAGRLQVDAELMQELSDIKNILPPQEILLVADAMLGQQSVNVAEGFHSQLGLTGLILTKVDGDARGGAALSIRQVTGIPIKFLGVGEKVVALEVFHPDRLAGRILDMGDVLSLVEKAQEVIDEKSAQESAKKMAKNQFTLEDFLSQIQMMKKMGGLEGLLKFLPGGGQIQKQMQNMAPPDKELKKIEAIIRSMTLKERSDPRVLNASRRERIAKGSGTQVQDVNRLVRQFDEAKKMMGGLMKMGMGRGGSGGFPGIGGGKFPF